MKIIVITSAEHIENEAAKIEQLLQSGVDYVHIRKPHWTTEQTRNLIESIPYKYHNRLRIHDYFNLINDYNLAGIHLNHRNNISPSPDISITKSCHTIEELEQSVGYDYIFISPIFDSISKQGYKSKFKIDEFKYISGLRNIIALGGVTPPHFKALKESGFYGVALLGYVWENSSENFNDIINNINKHK